MPRIRFAPSVLTVAGTLLVASAAVPSPAAAKTWKTSVTDPTGDAPSPGVDITEVKFRYKTNGSILFAITMAGPIDPATADAAVGVSFGSSCSKGVAAGGATFSQPDPAPFFTIKKGKAGKARRGTGEITGNVYTMSIKQRAFRHKKAGCFAVVLIDPATADTDAPTVFDTTGEVKLKH